MFQGLDPETWRGCIIPGFLRSIPLLLGAALCRSRAKPRVAFLIFLATYTTILTLSFTQVLCKCQAVAVTVTLLVALKAPWRRFLSQRPTPKSAAGDRGAPSPSAAYSSSTYTCRVKALPGMKSWKIQGVDPEDISREEILAAQRAIGRMLSAQRGSAPLARLHAFHGCILLSSTAHVALRDADDLIHVDSLPDPMDILPPHLRGRVTLVETVGVSGDSDDGTLAAEPAALAANEAGGHVELMTLRLDAPQCGHLDVSKLRVAAWAESASSSTAIQPTSQAWRRVSASCIECDLALPAQPAISSIVLRVGIASGPGKLASLLPFAAYVPVCTTGAAATEAGLHPELCEDLAHLMGVLSSHTLRPEDFHRGGGSYEWTELAFVIRDFASRNGLEALAEMVETVVLPMMLSSKKPSGMHGNRGSVGNGRSSISAATAPGLPGSGRVPAATHAGSKPFPLPRPAAASTALGASSSNIRDAPVDGDFFDFLPFGAPKGAEADAPPGILSPFLYFHDANLERMFLSRYTAAASTLHSIDALIGLPLTWFICEMLGYWPPLLPLYANWAITAIRGALIALRVPARYPVIYLRLSAVCYLSTFLAQSIPMARVDNGPRPFFKDFIGVFVGQALFRLLSHTTRISYAVPLAAIATSLQVAAYVQMGKWGKVAGEIVACVACAAVLYIRERRQRMQYAASLGMMSDRKDGGKKKL